MKNMASMIVVALLSMACQSPVNPKTEIERYEIWIESSANGSVSADKETAEAGETITLSIEPDKEYKLGIIRVTGASGFETIVYVSGGSYTFTMPEEDVTIRSSFVSSGLKKYSIIINIMINGAFQIIPSEGSQFETWLVTLIAKPEPGNKYRPGSLKVRTKNGKEEIKTDQAEGSDTEWIFEMPPEEVEVDADFIDEETELYDINIEKTANGDIKCGQSNAVPGDTVTFSLLPHDDYRYKSDSLIISPNVDDLTKISDDNGGTWSFIMPEESVSITAMFEEVPAHVITIPSLDEKGVVLVSPLTGSNTVREGKPVTVTLIVSDDENYRYIKDSINIFKTGSGEKLDFEATEELSWTFIMPAQAVTVDAQVEFIPFYSVTSQNVKDGRLIINGVEADGSYTGKARAGAVITITAVPDSGYKLGGSGLSVIPAGAVILSRLDTQSVWTFTMTERNIEINANFIELGPLEIYKGGARKGINVGALSDDNKYYQDSIEMESEEAGHNGNHQAIKINHAVNANDNTVQQSFGLLSDAEINIDGVAALSFWAKANKQLNIRYVGFGDDDNNKRVVYTGEGFNQSITITTEWQRYIVPVPVLQNGQKTTRAFLFNAQLAKGNYVCIDDIEFIETGVSLTAITIPDSCALPFYGATEAEKLLMGADIKLTYAASDGTITTLQAAANSHTLKYNLAGWLTPFIEVKGSGSTFTVTVKTNSVRSNSMAVNIIDGILLDDFEGWGKINIPATPATGSGYIWYNSASGSLITRDYTAAVNNEIYNGLSAGNWRPAANANNSRGGRNFDAKDIRDYNTLVFHIRVTAGTSSSTNYQKNTVFTFELKNGGTLTNKTNGNFFTQQFTYNTDGWQEVKMKLTDFIDAGLDASAVTGYAFSVVDNKDTALRISFDDIALVYE